MQPSRAVPPLIVIDPVSDSQMAEDRALVDRFLRDGSEAAFTTLYERHAPRMYGLARRLLGAAHAEADDILQEAWLRAATRLTAFRWQSALSTWLCGFIVNCCRERVPRLMSEVDPTEALVELPQDGPIDVERALASLPAGYRAILVLHDVYGYTHVEIGALLGIESGTSKSQLSRARRAMRLRLEGIGART